MSTDQISIQIPKTRFKEGSGFTATAKFRTRASAAADTPTTVEYRVDCLTTGTVVADWTTVSPASSVSISVTATHNAIQRRVNRYERKQLTVAADRSDSDAHLESVVYEIENLYGQVLSLGSSGGS